MNDINERACFAINAYSYNQTHTAQDALTHLSDAGYTHFELILYPGHIWPSEMDANARTALRRLMDERGLELLTLGSPVLDWNPVAVAPEPRAMTLEMIRASIELAGELGAAGVIMGPGKAHAIQPATKEELKGWLFAAFDYLVPLADDCGTQLLIENVPASFLPDAKSMMSMLDEYGDPRIGVVYDFANAFSIKEDPSAGLALSMPRLKRVHVSDTTWGVFHHDAVGDGDIDFSALGHQIAEANCGFPPVLELISSSPDADIPASVEALVALGWHELFTNRHN